MFIGYHRDFAAAPPSSCWSPPAADIQGLEGMGLLQASMEYHLGQFGVIFIAVILWLFSFSTFIGILFYARSNVAYLFGDNWISQTGYKILALIMLFVGGLATYTFVWDLGDVGIGLMTIFNILVILPMSKGGAGLPAGVRAGDEGAQTDTISMEKDGVPTVRGFVPFCYLASPFVRFCCDAPECRRGGPSWPPVFHGQ